MNAIKYTKGLIALIIYWTSLFLFLRLLFIFRYNNSIDDITSTLVHGLLGDASIVISIIALSSIILVFYSKSNSQRIIKTLKYFSFLLLATIFIVEYASSILYYEWGSTLTWRATSYLGDGLVGWKTMVTSLDLHIILYIILGVGFTSLLSRIYEFFFYRRTQLLNMIYRLVTSLFLLVIAGLSIRGGFQKTPYTSAISFFSHNSTENYTAVNKLRYYTDSYLQAKSIKEHVNVSDKNTYFTKTRSKIKGKSILKTERPNIILLVMEGIPNAVFDAIYNETINIPNLRRIKKSSYSYGQMYASGFRTDQGLLSLLAGIPAYPHINIMKDVEEVHNYPSIMKSLKQEGYHNSFLYGGDSQFSQLKKYLLSQKIDYLGDESNFTKKDRSMDWGVPDHIFIERSAQYINSLHTPHFTTILTSSTHPPFDYPGNDYRRRSPKENFIGSLEYFDKAIGKFISDISDTQDNNLIIITSDHGCLYLGHDFNDHERFHVPFMVLGNAVADSLLGTSNQHYYNTHDLPRSIESTLGLETNDYPLSSDITSSDSASSAYWITEHTMGWVSPNQKIVTNHTASELYFRSNVDQPSEIEVKNLLHYHNSTIHDLQSNISSFGKLQH